jgi:histidinol-phosphate aminotransferase
LLDEAYCELDEIPSLQDMIKDHPNLIIVKTFSKIYGLAGARVGYAIAQANTIQKLAALVPWPHSGISNLSAQAAIASLSDQEFILMCQRKNREARDYTLQSLRSMGIEAIPSYTNFIYFPVSKLKGNYFDQMKENKVDIRSWQEKGNTYCRVSIGTLDEMKAFIKYLGTSLT